MKKTFKLPFLLALAVFTVLAAQSPASAQATGILNGLRRLFRGEAGSVREIGVVEVKAPKKPVVEEQHAIGPAEQTHTTKIVATTEAAAKPKSRADERLGEELSVGLTQVVVRRKSATDIEVHSRSKLQRAERIIDAVGHVVDVLTQDSSSDEPRLRVEGMTDADARSFVAAVRAQSGRDVHAVIGYGLDIETLQIPANPVVQPEIIDNGDGARLSVALNAAGRYADELVIELSAEPGHRQRLSYTTTMLTLRLAHVLAVLSPQRDSHTILRAIASDIYAVTDDTTVDLQALRLRLRSKGADVYLF